MAIHSISAYKGGQAVFEDCIKNLLAAIWYQALKDFKKDQTNEYLRNWIINEGHCICVPHLSKREAEEVLNEYLSK